MLVKGHLQFAARREAKAGPASVIHNIFEDWSPILGKLILTGHDLQFSQLASDDEAFRVACLLLGRDGAYNTAPFGSVGKIYNAVKAKNYVLALSQNRARGVILWVTIDDATRLTCLQQGRMPSSSEVTEGGSTIVPIAVGADSPQVLRCLIGVTRKYKASMHVLYQRHVGRTAGDVVHLPPRVRR